MRILKKLLFEIHVFPSPSKDTILQPGGRVDVLARNKLPSQSRKYALGYCHWSANQVASRPGSANSHHPRILIFRFWKEEG